MTTADALLLKATADGDLAGVSAALAQGANVNTRDEYDNSALNWAALWGHEDVVEKLFEAGADLENRGSGGGMTPLANAASRGYFKVAQRLLDRGARVTDDLLAILQTKVNILEESRESGTATAHAVAVWTRVLELFISHRKAQDGCP